MRKYLVTHWNAKEHFVCNCISVTSNRKKILAHPFSLLPHEFYALFIRRLREWMWWFLEWSWNTQYLSKSLLTRMFPNLKAWDNASLSIEKSESRPSLTRAALIKEQSRCNAVVFHKTHWKHSLQIEKQLACWIVIITRSKGSFSQIDLPLCLIIGFLKW